MPTVRAMLATFTGAEHVEGGAELFAFEAATAHWGASEGGLLQTACGMSRVLVTFAHPATRVRVHLVIDDAVGLRWEHERRQQPERLPAHPRPFPKLRLALS